MIKGILSKWLGVTALQEGQKIDAERFESLFSTLQEFQKAQDIDAGQFQEVFGALKKWQEAQQIDVEQFEKVFSALEGKIGTEQFQSMQEHLNGLQEKMETLTEVVAEQEKVMLTCCIVASVIALAAISFIGFCIYQGVKCEREKQKNSSAADQGTPKTNFDVHNTDRQEHSMEV